MKRFADFGIKTQAPSFQGDKIKIERILNLEITVHDYRVEDSKVKEKTKCLWLQISISGTMRVVFTGSTGLLEAIEQVPKSDFPFTTTIVRENERFQFT